MSQEVVWFIQPQDRHTNDVIVSRISAENFVEERDGVENLWRCPSYSYVSNLDRSKESLKLRFKVYRARGNGKLEKWKFLRKKKKA